MLTTIQMRGQVEAILGFNLNLRLYETVASVTITDDKIVVLTTVYKVKQLVRETRFTAKGQRAMQFNLTQIADSKFWHWTKTAELTLWDEDYEPETLATLRRVETPAEWNDRRNFEADCYRPGSESFPMDNYDRAMIQPELDTDQSHEKMVRHWQRLGKVAR